MNNKTNHQRRSIAVGLRRLTRAGALETVLESIGFDLNSMKTGLGLVAIMRLATDDQDVQHLNERLNEIKSHWPGVLCNEARAPIESDNNNTS